LLIYCCFDFTGKLHTCICYCDHPPLCLISQPGQPVRLGLGFMVKFLLVNLIHYHSVHILFHPRSLKNCHTNQSPFFLWFFMCHSLSYMQPQCFTKTFLQECVLIDILYDFDILAVIRQPKCSVYLLCSNKNEQNSVLFSYSQIYLLFLPSLYLKRCTRRPFSRKNSISPSLLIQFVECKQEREILVNVVSC